MSNAYNQEKMGMPKASLEKVKFKNREEVNKKIFTPFSYSLICRVFFLYLKEELSLFFFSILDALQVRSQPFF